MQCPRTPHGSLIPSADCPQVLPSGSHLFLKLDLAFCLLFKKKEIAVIFVVRSSMFDTTLLVVTQHFEMIAKAHVASYEKPQETAEAALKEI